MGYGNRKSRCFNLDKYYKFIYVNVKNGRNDVDIIFIYIILKSGYVCEEDVCKIFSVFNMFGWCWFWYCNGL